VDQLFKDLQNPAWWFTAVVAALILNVLAAYLKEWFDATISSFSVRRRQEVTAKLERRRARIERLTQDAEYRERYTYMEFRSRFRSLHWLCVSIVGAICLLGIAVEPSPLSGYAIATVRIVAFGVTALTLISSQRHRQMAASIHTEIGEAMNTMKLRREQNPPNVPVD
jgi:hypothetical protein